MEQTGCVRAGCPVLASLHSACARQFVLLNLKSTITHCIPLKIVIKARLKKNSSKINKYNLFISKQVGTSYNTYVLKEIPIPILYYVRFSRNYNFILKKHRNSSIVLSSSYFNKTLVLSIICLFFIKSIIRKMETV